MNRVGTPLPASRTAIAFAAVLLWLAVGLPQVQAVILFSTDDPTANTTPPEGALTNSGWQFQGLWNVFLGTPISPKMFLTAKHVRGSDGQPFPVGEPFIYRGRTYLTTARFDDPESDLQIWSVCGTFPDYAPLFEASDEAGRNLVVFGRGTLRGTNVTVGRGVLKGWAWGPWDQSLRWGENTVEDVVNAGAGFGELLHATFDAGAGPNECHLSFGDSTGGLFIQDAGTWKLAGINLAVDGPYNTVAEDPGFNAALFDQGGLFNKTSGTWQFLAETPQPRPGGFYATRVSSRLPWIQAILTTPPPPDAPPALESASDPAGPYQPEGASADILARTLTLPLPSQPTFYRLNTCSTLRLTSTEVTSTQLVLHYE